MKIEDVTVMDLATDPRETLGDQVPFFFYRYLSLFAVADSKGAFAEKALFDGGYNVGSQLVRDMRYTEFSQIAEHYQMNGLAILTKESEDNGVMRVRLEECATCCGLPPVDMPLCHFDGGILAGALQAIAKSSTPYGAREIECAGLGNPTCLFEIGPGVSMTEEEG